MLVLALDTATPTVVVGVLDTSAPADSGRFRVSVRAQQSAASDNRHAETLGLLIPDVLAEADIGMTDLGAIVVGLGPGPFTGLRVGVMTAAALGDARGLPVHGVCTHDAIAATHAAHPGTIVEAAGLPEVDAAAEAGSMDAGFAVVTDARRRECYWAGYDASGARISGPHVEAPKDMVARPDWPADGLVIGDRLFSDALGTEVITAGPDPMGLVVAARGRLAGEAAEPLEPLYLRRPDTSPPTARKRVTPR